MYARQSSLQVFENLRLTHLLMSYLAGTSLVGSVNFEGKLSGHSKKTETAVSAENAARVNEAIGTSPSASGDAASAGGGGGGT